MKRLVKKILKNNEWLYLKTGQVYKKLEEFQKKRKGKRRFRNDKDKYIKLFQNSNDLRFAYIKEYERPCLSDWNQNAGRQDAYLWQDLWAARLIYKQNPTVHYDIGSRIDGFITHLASFRENIQLIDVRPFKMNIPGVNFTQADATLLEGIEDNSLESISALCSLEHFGLGRYGDSINPTAYYQAMKSIVRVLAWEGHAYISVPIGWEHLEFNAHRVFYAATIVEIFKPLRLVEFSSAYGTEYEENIKEIHKFDNDKTSLGGRFGFFHFVKKFDS